jgi:hypothetical protein
MAITPRDDPHLRRFLIAMGRSCSLRQAEPADAVAAWIVTDDSDQRLITTSVPVFVWTRDARRAATDWPPTAILLCAGQTAGDEAGRLVVPVPEPAVDTSTVTYVNPLLRARWRNRYGMPADLVVTLEADGRPRDLPIGLRDTALAVAAVAVATGDAVLDALAWGAPTVSDSQTAERLLLGEAAWVAPPDQLVDAARNLARSQTRMSELSWAGRSLVEARFDLVSAVNQAFAIAELPVGAATLKPLHALLAELRASEPVAWSIIRQVSD